MKNKKVIIIFACLAAALLIIIGYEWYRINILRSNAGEVDARIDGYNSSVKAAFYTYNDKVFFCNKDSVQIFDDKGQKLVSDTYNMNAPYIVGCENIVGVSEPNGREVRIYNEYGKMYESDDGTVLSFSVNKNGESVVIFKEEGSYRIVIYNGKGEKRYEVNIAVADGIPTMTALSPSGRILAINCVVYDDVKMSSNILLFDTDSKSRNASKTNRENSDAASEKTPGGKLYESNDLRSAKKLENELCAVMKFVDESKLAVVSDKQAACYDVSASEEMKMIWNYEVKNEIEALNISDDGYIVLAYGKPLINKVDAYEENTVIWYDNNGNITNKFVSGREVDRLTSAFDSTIVCAGRNFKSIKNEGGMEWEYNSLSDVKDMRYVTSTGRVLLVSNREAVIINPRNIYEEETTEESTEKAGKGKTKNDVKTEEKTETTTSTEMEEIITENAAEPIEEPVQEVIEEPVQEPTEEYAPAPATQTEEMAETPIEEPIQEPTEEQASEQNEGAQAVIPESTAEEAPAAPEEEVPVEDNVEADGPFMGE
ncbi:MAG: hypothetical protein IJ583_11155 [Firmicutes bacterium]|nr:hypothetical protein [Bacillota bacterium]